LILTVAAIPVFIEYVRRADLANIYWITSSLLDVIGMMFVCSAFVWEDTKFEIPLGVIGSVVLLGTTSNSKKCIRFFVKKNAKNRE
jgi:hypothetical protein